MYEIISDTKTPEGIHYKLPYNRLAQMEMHLKELWNYAEECKKPRSKRKDYAKEYYLKNKDRYLIRSRKQREAKKLKER